MGIMGHRDDCQCIDCTDYRRAQLGINLLKQMKELKATEANKAGNVQIDSNLVINIEPGQSVSLHRCGKCAKAFQIREEGRFCPYCGDQFVKSEQPQAVRYQMKICKRCNTGMPAEAKSCPTCGIEQ